jgi:hypothetical protein
VTAVETWIFVGYSAGFGKLLKKLGGGGGGEIA